LISPLMHLAHTPALTSRTSISSCGLFNASAMHVHPSS
jgi:hypothetical protein